MKMREIKGQIADVPNRKYSLVHKANKKSILAKLFEDGVVVVENKPNLPVHPEIEVPNLHVLMVMKSLHSRKMVSCLYNWCHFYYYITDDGVAYLRTVLHKELVDTPATLRSKTPAAEGGGQGGGDRDQPWRKGGGGGGGGGGGDSSWRNR